MSLGDNIKKRRNEKGITLLELAESIGVREATVQRYESGSIKNVKHETIIKIANALETTPGDLMGWDNKINNTLPDDLSDRCKELYELCKKLNDLGETMTIEYVKLLLTHDEYKKKSKGIEGKKIVA